MGKGSRVRTSSWGESTWHHIVSQSIGGPDIPENKYRWTIKKHRAYHQLFYNFLPSIVIKIIGEWSDEKGELNIKKMGAKNFRAWKRAFGDWKPAEVIQFIEENFLPKEKKFLKGELK